VKTLNSKARRPFAPAPVCQHDVVRPQVVAHRGSSSEEPEHTLKAYERAIEVGADALECDVRLTADGHLVCVHDRRVNRTSNGQGRVSTLELATLEKLDWGSWKTDWADAMESEQPDRNRGQLLTLRALLTVVAAADRPVDLAIETKHPTRYAGQVERKLFQVLDEFDLLKPRPDGTHPARMMSFSSVALARMRQLSPELPLVQLTWDRLRVRWLLESKLPKAVRTVGMAIGLLERVPDLAAKVHDAGYDLHVYTVDRTAQVDLCVRLGVDAIITNRPRHVLDLLGAGPRP
jgi:glycerophosphoryl diester phosphodiesterase